MTTKKTVRVPEAREGVPSVVPAQHLDKTRELPASENAETAMAMEGLGPQAAPCEILDDDVTVPVQSSIESTLTFELLRRQSTEEDDDDKA